MSLCPGCGGDEMVLDEDNDYWTCPMCGGTGDEADINEEDYPTEKEVDA